MFGVGILIFAALCFLCYLLFRKNRNFWKLKGVPFEKPLPLVGNLLSVVLLQKSMPNMLADLYFKFANEPFFGVWLWHEPHLILRSPELIKQILIKDFDHFHDRNVQSNEDVDGLSANMMFFTRQPKWKFIRTVTTPMFSSGKVKYIYPQIQKVAKDMISYMSTRNTKPLEPRNLAIKYATDVICSVAFGIDSYSFQDKATPFTQIGKDVFATTIRNTATSITYFSKNSIVDTFKIKFIPTSIANFITQAFLGIVEERQSGNSDRKDLVDVMIKCRDEHNLNDLELVAQAAQFFLAGYETTSATINYALYEIALNKDVQDKLRGEINQNIHDDEEFAYYTLKDMPYIHQITLETLRKYPPVPFLGRSCSVDYKIPNTDVVIEKGTAVMIPLMGLHYDPEHFPNPQRFDPERFSPENLATSNPYCHLPFGNGPRSCIGERIALLSVKLALAHIVKHFELELVKGTPTSLKFLATTFLLRTDPFYINFKTIT